MKRLILTLALCLSASVAQAQTRSSLTDARIQFVDYDPDRIVTIRGVLDYQLMLEFAPEERIENVSIGDSLGWQVTPNRQANALFLKPIDGSATNMTVLTSQRRYIFDLSVAPKSALATVPYTVRFIYPEPMVVAVEAPVVVPEAPPVVANADYTIAGARENQPIRVFDDGQMTYFEWSAQNAIPAIFAVAADGSESVVNYNIRGPLMVVEQLSGRFILRNGEQVATVTNNRLSPPSDRRAAR